MLLEKVGYDFNDLLAYIHSNKKLAADVFIHKDDCNSIDSDDCIERICDDCFVSTNFIDIRNGEYDANHDDCSIHFDAATGEKDPICPYNFWICTSCLGRIDYVIPLLEKIIDLDDLLCEKS